MTTINSLESLRAEYEAHESAKERWDDVAESFNAQVHEYQRAMGKRQRRWARARCAPSPAAPAEPSPAWGAWRVYWVDDVSVMFQETWRDLSYITVPVSFLFDRPAWEAERVRLADEAKAVAAQKKLAEAEARLNRDHAEYERLRALFEQERGL